MRIVFFRSPDARKGKGPFIEKGGGGKGGERVVLLFASMQLIFMREGLFFHHERKGRDRSILSRILLIREPVVHRGKKRGKKRD